MAKTISADELQKNRENYILIDVREQEELLGGHIDDSVHLPLGQLIRKIRKTEKDEFGPEERHRLFWKFLNALTQPQIAHLLLMPTNLLHFVVMVLY